MAERDIIDEADFQTEASGDEVSKAIVAQILSWREQYPSLGTGLEVMEALAQGTITLNAEGTVMVIRIRLKSKLCTFEVSINYD